MPAINEVIRLTVIGNVQGQTHMHTLHFLQQAAGNALAGLITSWSGNPMLQYRNCFHNTDSPVQMIRAQYVCGTVPLPAPLEVTPVAASQLGTRSTVGDALPSFVACVVRERGEFSGRRYSGRFFIGGLYEVDVAGNSLAASYITLVTNYPTSIKEMFIDPVSPDLRLFSFSSLLANGDPNHTKRNPVPGGARIPDPVTAVQCQNAGSRVMQLLVNPRPTTMRSRKWGHGT